MGMHEAITYSFTSPHIYQKIGITDAADYPPVVRIANPWGRSKHHANHHAAFYAGGSVHNYNRRIENCSILRSIHIYPKALR